MRTGLAGILFLSVLLHGLLGYLLWWDGPQRPAWRSRNAYRQLVWCYTLAWWVLVAKAWTWYTELWLLIRAHQ